MSKPLLIQVIPTLGGGGAEREVARVSKVLNEHGPFQVMVCCLMGRGGFADEVQKAGVEVVVLHEGRRFSPVMAWDLMRFLRDQRPLIVHSHLVRWGPVVAKLAGVPIAIASEHTLAPWRGTMSVLYDRANACFADTIIAVAEAIREVRMKRWRIPASKVVTIPNAVEVADVAATIDKAVKRAELGLPLDVPVVGTIGRLLPIKGQSYFIDAAAEVLKARPDCRFLILGEGPCWEQLERQVQELGVTDAVRILGFRDDAREILQIMDIMCLSSLTEGTPITVLEAMACGKPVVVTRVGGCPEVVVDGVTGFIVSPCDPPAMARAILKLIDDASLAARMGEAGLHRVQTEYSTGRNLEQLLDLYSGLLTSKGLTFDSAGQKFRSCRRMRP